MFDIKEYYQDSKHTPKNTWDNFSDIEEDIAKDVDSMLTNRFDNLYLRDRYKNNDVSMDIIYPRLSYPGNKSLVISPDKIRFLLSFYPDKESLTFIEKLVIRPRYIEIDNVELVSLYLGMKKILVLYLTHPFYYRLEDEGENKKFVSSDIQNFIKTKLLGSKSESRETGKIKAHPLWYIISTLSHTAGTSDIGTSSPGYFDRKIDKFFVRRGSIENATYQNLNDISLYYSRHGY